MVDLGRGNFQINDIILDIPPEQISVQRRSANNSWQTLRTRSSAKVKSGFSMLDITISAKFTDTIGPAGTNGLDKLRALVSQFRVTPFCYIENAFIRDTILNGDNTDSMALALRQIDIRTDTESTNCLIVTFRFAWFNYKPYMNDFRFRSTILSPKSVTNPSESFAWKALYLAEQKRHSYSDAPARLDESDVTFSVTQFTQYKVEAYKQLQKEVEALGNLRNLLQTKLRDYHGGSLSKEVEDILVRDLSPSPEDDWDVFTARAFGTTTSIGTEDLSTAGGLTAAINNQLDPKKTTQYTDVLNETEWRVQVLRNGNIVNIKDAPGHSFEDDAKKTGQVLLRREHTMSTSALGVVPVQVSISFENILATLPLTGHTYPTYQHIGSMDAVVSITMLTANEAAVREIASLYGMVEAQAYKYRNIPAGHRNLKISNSIINMVGLHEFVTENISFNTVPGQPGTTQIHLQLVDSSVTTNTREILIPSSTFSLEKDWVVQVARVLGEHLEEKKNIYTNKDGVGEFAATGEKITTEPIGPHGQTREVSTATDGKLYTSTVEGDDRKFAFSKLVDEYNDRISSTVRDLGWLVQNIKESHSIDVIPENTEGVRNPTSTSHQIIALMLMNDGDVVGIERMQATLKPLFKQNAKLASFVEGRRGDIPLQVDQFEQLQGAQVNNKPVTGNEAKLNVFDLYNRYNEVKARRESSEETNAEMESILNDIETYRAGQLMVRVAKQKVIAGSGRWAMAGQEGKIDKAYLDSEAEAVSISALINKIRHSEILADWENDTTRWIKTKIIAGGLLNLEEFKDVADLMNTNEIVSGSNGYPDFPMAQVVEVLNEFKDTSSVNALTKLEKKARSPGGITRGHSAATLLNPDFYIHYGSNDTNDIIGQELINSAKDSIQTSHDTQRGLAEENWIEGYYKDSLGAEAYDQVNKALNTSLSLTHNAHWLPTGKEGPEASKAKQVIEGATQNFQSQLGSKQVLHPIDLQHTIPQSIEAYKNHYGKGIQLTERKRNVAPVEGSNKHPQKSGFTINTRSNSELTPARENSDNSLATLSHVFGTAVLDELGPLDIWPSELNLDEDSTPAWYFPTALRRKPGAGGDFGPRDLRAPPLASKNHKGLDFSIRAGSTVFAAATGVITRVQTEEEAGGAGRGAGNNIRMKHSGGYYTKYFHLKNDAIFQSLYKQWHDGGKKPLFWLGGAPMASVGSTGSSSGPHLHFQIHQGGFSTSQAVDPWPHLTGASYAYPAPVSTAGAGPGDSVFTKSIEQFEANLHRGQGPSLMRAYPTFKLYFIESDMGERKRFGFDDFFGYNAIKEIQVVRSRKLAADLCVIQLTNISGTLSNRKFRNEQDPGLARDQDGNIVKERLDDPKSVDTKDENPIASLLLQPGVQIQLRLGYENNPDLLEKVFNGMIMDVEFTADDDLVTIVCQSYGVELVHTVYGDVKKVGGTFSNKGATSQIVEEVLGAPELVHFGRWKPGEGGNPLGDAKQALTNRWSFNDSPVDDNVWAPVGAGIWGIFDWTPTYILYQSTIWDVLQEMTYRHPGYIACPVPYDGKWGPRMTMFFGVPDQLYYARDPTFAEENVLSLLGTVVDETIDNLEEDIEALFKTQNLNEEDKELILKAKDGLLEEDEGRERVLRKLVRQLGLDRGFIRSFRNYHVVTGGMHILMNNIQSASHNTFNSVTVQYEDDSWGADVEEGTGSIEFDDPETFTLKADAGIPEEDVRELFVQYPNCNGEPMAIRYALSHLKNSLKEGYKGSLVIVGNPQIKPHDIVYIFDEYSDMFGPVEVEQVVHKFSQQNGFISEITPDMCVHVNELSTMSTLDAMGLIAEGALVSAGMARTAAPPPGNATVLGAVEKGLQGAFWLGTVPIAAMVFGSSVFGQSESAIGQESPSSFGILGLAGAFIYRKLFMRTQLAHPFRFSPLVHHGKPLLGGAAAIKKTGGSFVQRADKWLEDTKKDSGLYIDHLKDTMNPNNWFGNSSGNFSNYFKGTEQDFTKRGS